MSKRVVIVDDSGFLAKQIKDFFEKQMGFEVIAIGKDGNEAVSLYKEHKPDLMTMDLTMPGMGGLEAIRQLKAQEPAANILVISALGQKHAVFEALQLGAKNYIVKPINEENLQSVVRLLLSETTKEAAHG